VERVLNAGDVSVGGFDHDVGESKQPHDEIMQFVIFEEELMEVGAGDLVGSVSYLHYASQLACAHAVLLLQQTHELLHKVFFPFD
jgi:hypothetical protein